jgi:hypothetical protein
MSQCGATKPDGERCRLPSKGSDGYCWSHSPENAQAHLRKASRGGRAKADKELRETKAEIRELVRLVKEEDFDVSKANTINRLYQTLLQYILVERGVYREEELAQRIKELAGK